MSIKCPKCGKIIKLASKHCPDCGFLLIRGPTSGGGRGGDPLEPGISEAESIRRLFR
jgi:transposase